MCGVGDEIVLRDIVVSGPCGGIGDDGEARGWFGGGGVVDAGRGRSRSGSGGEGGEGFDAVCVRLGGGDWVLDHACDDGSFFFRRLTGTGVGGLVEFTEGAGCGQDGVTLA